MQAQDLALIVAQLPAIARHTGGIIMAVRASGDLGIVEKVSYGRNSPVTRADKEANAYLTEALKHITPGIDVLSEEGDMQHNHTIARTHKRFWLVDPLDGTHNFIKGLDYFAVNIAFIEEGKPIAGAVYFPAQQTLYYTGGDGKAYRARDGEKPVPIQAKRAQSGRIPLIALGYRDNQEHIRQMGVAPLVAAQEPLHAANAQRICMAAEGSCHLAIGSNYTSTWDTAAPDAVLRAAGGVLINAHTKLPMSYGADAQVMQDGKLFECANPPYLAGREETIAMIPGVTLPPAKRRLG